MPDGRGLMNARVPTGLSTHQVSPIQELILVKVSAKAAGKNKPGSVPRTNAPKITEPKGQVRAHEPVIKSLPVPGGWSDFHSYLLLTVATLGALLPFSGRAFHIDDTLFVWAAQNIVKHPLNPYGFKLNWVGVEALMSQTTKNPPLASYYGAAIGAIAGWSERAFHLGFLLPALALILLTYYLAKDFTDSPLVAAAATLVAPGFLVSASSVMCDTMMLAIWLLAVILWLKGMESGKPLQLGLAALLVGACALTKYFGASLILLLLAYSLYRQRRLGAWALYLLLPAAILAAYQHWSAALYGRGLLADAAGFATVHRQNGSFFGGTIEGISFVGGCMFPALAFAPVLWSRRQLWAGAALSVVSTLAIATGAVNLGKLVGVPVPGANGGLEVSFLHDHLFLFSLQLTLCVAGGISVLALAIADFRETKTDKSLLLLLWVLGTFAFAAFFNWTVNARSVLPLLPAASILLARRLGTRQLAFRNRLSMAMLLPLLASGCLALWVTTADSQMANSERTAANALYEHYPDVWNHVWFEGHWGFQYYMQKLGAKPLAQNTEIQNGDVIVIPENNTELMDVDPDYIVKRESLALPGSVGAATMSNSLGAGFYAAFWGPLPFALGPVQDERYLVVHMSGQKRLSR